MSNSLVTHYAHYLAPSILTITVTSPANGATIQSAEFDVVYTFSPGPQETTRVQIYSDSGGTTEVYDTGVLVQSALSVTIPAGPLANGVTYWLRVTATNDQGQVAQSGLVQFDLDVLAQSTIDSVSVTPRGGQCTPHGPETLPRAEVTWSQVNLDASETFVEYRVLKRQSGASTWTRIATLKNDATHTEPFVDAQITPWQWYEYTVIAIVTDGAGNTLETAKPAAQRAKVDTDFCFMHLIGNGGSCDEDTTVADADANAWERWVRFDNWNASLELEQELTRQRTRGSEKPAAFVGDQLVYTVDIPGHPRMLDDRAFWTKIEDLFTGQRELPSVVCLRFGRARMMLFVALQITTRDHSQMQYTPGARLGEVRWTESEWFCQWLTP